MLTIAGKYTNQRVLELLKSRKIGARKGRSQFPVLQGECQVAEYLFFLDIPYFSAFLYNEALEMPNIFAVLT